MTTAVPVRWVLSQPVAGGGVARRRLFCFPFAGGGATAFRGWSHELPRDLEVCAVVLPGRESRLRDAPIAEVSRLIPALAEGLAAQLDRPFALFGHSVGALVAFELARELRRRGARAPEHVFVSAFRAPTRANVNRVLHALPEPELLQELRSYGGIPDAVLDSRELLDLVLPTIRADFALHETYVHRPEPPLATPLTVFGGTRDDKVKPEHLEGWQAQTTGRFRQELFAGDHFFLKSCRPQMSAVIAEELTR
jgi:surfactin synthase thioesterase subunit